MEKDSNPEQLYEEYLAIKDRIRPVAQIDGPATSGTYKTQIIDFKDLVRLKEVARELVNRHAKFLRSKPGVFLSVQLEANEECRCGHPKHTHNGLRGFNENDEFPTDKKDGACKGTNCHCKQFILDN